jgi:bacteriorhodopsin
MDIKRPDSSLLGTSFNITFLALAGTTLLTISASLSAGSAALKKNRPLMDALLFENAVNLIASYMYSTYFLRHTPMPQRSLSDITQVRYTDWLLTTPLLIVSLAQLMDYYNRGEDTTPAASDLPIGTIAGAIALNIVMLAFGYLAETGRISKSVGALGGFAAFAGLCAIMKSLSSSGTGDRLWTYFVVTWGLYGGAYFLRDPVLKNVAYNTLDMVSKVFLGLLTVWTIVNNNRKA